MSETGSALLLTPLICTRFGRVARNFFLFTEIDPEMVCLSRADNQRGWAYRRGSLVAIGGNAEPSVVQVSGRRNSTRSCIVAISDPARPRRAVKNALSPEGRQYFDGTVSVYSSMFGCSRLTRYLSSNSRSFG